MILQVNILKPNKLLSLSYLTQSMADPLRNISIAYMYMDRSMSVHRFNETKNKASSFSRCFLEAGTKEPWGLI